MRREKKNIHKIRSFLSQVDFRNAGNITNRANLYVNDDNTISQMKERYAGDFSRVMKVISPIDFSALDNTDVPLRLLFITGIALQDCSRR